MPNNLPPKVCLKASSQHTPEQVGEQHAHTYQVTCLLTKDASANIWRSSTHGEEAWTGLHIQNCQTHASSNTHTTYTPNKMPIKEKGAKPGVLRHHAPC